MPRPTAFLALLLLAAALTACDTTAPPSAEGIAGASFEGTTLALRDAQTGDLVYDYLANGGEISVTFEDADRFTARLFIPREALIASGEVYDTESDVDETVTGTYRVESSAVTFEDAGFSDTFFDDEGWTLIAGATSLRYTGGGEDMEVDVVLTRR